LVTEKAKFRNSNFQRPNLYFIIIVTISKQFHGFQDTRLLGAA
jgi:hypothetical protein